MSCVAASTRQRAAAMSARRPSRSAGTAAGMADRLDLRQRARLQSQVGLAHQCGERIARELHLLLQRLDLLARLGQRAFALALLQRGVQARVDAVAHQLQRLLALRQRALRDLQLVLQPRQLEVAARDIAGQQHARRLDLGLRRARAAQRGLERLAVPAEEIELPAGAHLQRAELVDRAAQRRRIDAGAREALAARLERALHLRQRGRPGQFLHRLRARQAGLRHAQVGAALQRLVDELVQLRVAERLPPLRGELRRRRRACGQADVGPGLAASPAA